MADAQLEKDVFGEGRAAIHIRNSKTNQFNECDFKTLKAVDGSICPAQAVARLITSKQWGGDSDEKVFGQWIRTRLRAFLRLA